MHDAKGHSVIGLGKDDFAVTHDGAPQQIRFWCVETGDQAPVRPPGPEPRVVSNLRQRLAVSPGVTVTLFDAMNISRDDLVYAQRQMVEFLRQLTPRRPSRYTAWDKTRE